ncbi:MAG: NHL repeat-containing protein [candidate division Zixibacteria bacterium]|nr:NHL repeat-containing protein [candidate division Zixibacteria bacterium]
MNRTALIIGGVVALICGCGRPPHTEPPATSTAAPLAVVVDTIISGEILGQTMKQPTGLAIDAGGNLIVSDAGNHRVVRFTSALVPETEVGGYGTQAGLFIRPGYMVVDASGMRVVDEGNKRICRLDKQLRYVDQINFSDLDNPLDYGTPAGVAIDRSGYIWVTDREKSRVVVYDVVGQFNRFIAEYGYSGGALSSPEKVMGVQSGDHVICDAGNHRIVIYDQYGNYDRAITDMEFQSPVAVSIDRDGRFWILDQKAGRIFVFSPTGARLLAVGPDIPGGGRMLSAPSDIVVDGERVIVADTGNDRILICRGLSQ